MKVITSQGDFQLEPEYIEYIAEFKEFVDEFDKRALIIDTPLNPTGINKLLKEYFSNYFDKEQKDEYNINYIPKDDTHFIIIFDHLGLVKSESGFNKKQTIDKLCEYMLFIRKEKDEEDETTA
jgi:hypothetical protein